MRTGRSSKAGAAVNAAAARMSQARGSMLPKVNYSESFTRSEQPGFRFRLAADAAPVRDGELQHRPAQPPRSLNNFQSQLTVDQVLYDGGQTATRRQVRCARPDMSAEDRRRAEMLVIAGVGRAPTTAPCWLPRT